MFRLAEQAVSRVVSAMRIEPHGLLCVYERAEVIAEYDDKYEYENGNERNEKKSPFRFALAFLFYVFIVLHLNFSPI